MFGDRLRELRKNKDISQKELGNLLNLSPNAIYNWEVGRSQPTVEAIAKLANYFGVSTDYLLGFTQEDADSIERLKTVLKEVGWWDYNIDDMNKEDFEKAMAIMKTLKEREKNKES